MSAKDVLTLVIAGAGTAIALGTLAKAVVEFSQQGRLKRAEQFLSLRRRLKENAEFALIAEHLDLAATGRSDEQLRANEALKATLFRIKRDYLGLFEEVALAVNSRLININVASYMFGYYALLCRRSDAFWDDVNRLSPYWSLFNDFCSQVEVLDSGYRTGDFEFRRRSFRF